MFSLLSCLSLLLAAAPAAPADAAPGPVVEAPRRTDTVEVPYPESELAARREADVVLMLTLDENGAVTESEVVRSAGAAFDEAARAASLTFRFEPARMEGRPVACRIELVHSFRLAPEAPASPAPAEPTASAETTTPAEPVPAEPTPTGEERVHKTTVRGQSEAERMRQSAEAVKVVDTRHAKAQSADLGQVLAQQEGVAVRRTGGLGSSARFSLNGLSDEQIRFFLDGIPLELAGHPFGIANVPVNLVERIEVYRGVVPVRYGADALGGAVNLVSAPLRGGAHGAISLQGGSFGTWRLALAGSYSQEPGGFFARAHLFADTARNNYPIDVEVADDQGRLQQATVPRFHDGYKALGGGLDVGLMSLGWADRLVFRAFGSGTGKELQHNLVMRGVPYGEAHYGVTSAGGQLLYEKAFTEALRLDVVGGYGWQATDFVDVSNWVYDWYGQRVRERTLPGEIGGEATDQTLRQHAAYGRANVAWTLSDSQRLRLSLAPTQTWRTGEQRLTTNGQDPLAAERELFTAVLGLEYELDLFDDALEVILFGKDYHYVARAQALAAGGGWRREDRDQQQLGGGVALRVRLASPLYLKVSYERATRHPRVDEVFGNGVLIHENLELEPELSHNINLGLATSPLRSGLGTFRGELNGFARLAQNLIILLGDNRDWRYQNVYGARVLGVEGSAGWSSSGSLFHVDANATVQDARNASAQGTFGAFDGDRLPNRPWFFANATARMSVRELLAARDELSPFWSARYIHEFVRGWESAGAQSTKDVIPSQFVQTAGVGYRVSLGERVMGLTAEVENLGDARNYDFFGVQRPGRSFWLKGTFEY
ncbi:TonB-dependent siderophore myxochelin receptor MxcH [Vitiosangium sp. GDMCC 1.1324]|uniref:TonB-dependent siderophore myxochelin receptor MxcH n=1 Tax=Vitiosangium sp. (strain GDMCC 1.1324) TaxID=2138576 RepID=UPI000D3BBD9A|nr:TonB-dependent siderophore myxochelin receptor MxcH [Vitiosangium sp. GDMCC 1.1324]PTL84462.1 TonB-dependent receptor [Vitiosangium sp. GDMCC 1.1324]